MNLPKKEKFDTDKEILIKISSFCSYQERNQQEVRVKLYSFGLEEEKVEEIISELIKENFINEERFAKLYAGGKFRIKSWGRIKITLALKQKEISEYCIRQAMKEIPEGDYIERLSSLIEKKFEKEAEMDLFKRKYKVARHVINKGFEPDLVWSILKDSY